MKGSLDRVERDKKMQAPSTSAPIDRLFAAAPNGGPKSAFNRLPSVLVGGSDLPLRSRIATAFAAACESARLIEISELDSFVSIPVEIP